MTTNTISRARTFLLLTAAAATLTVGTAGTAWAGGNVPRPDRPSDPSTQTVNNDNDLDAVAGSLSLRHKSVSVVIEAAPHRQVSKPVQISIAYGESHLVRSDQTYVPGSGNRFHYDFPVGDGNARSEEITINLIQSDDSRQLIWHTDIQPLWDVMVSPAKFTMAGWCDSWGDNQVELGWNRPDGSGGERAQDMDDGDVLTINEFAYTGRDVSVATNLARPSVSWREDDWEPANDFHGHGDNSAAPRMLPGESRTVAYNSTGDTEETACHGHIEWTETIRLRTYPGI